MFRRNEFSRSEPIVWVRNGNGGPGYANDAPGRVVRSGDSRVTVLVYREADRTWLMRSVGRDELRLATADEVRRIEALEAEARNHAPDLPKAA